MKKLFIYLSVSVFISFNSYGALPTVEGLLQNASNPDVSGYGEFSIKVTSVVEDTESSNSRFFKIFVPKDEMVISQLEFGTERFSGAALNKKSVFFQELQEKTNIEQMLTYALFSMLTANNPRGMKNFLNQTSPDFRDNLSLINGAKQNLYRQYQSYLYKIKRDSSLKNQITSPLLPEDPERRAKVRSLMQEPLIKSNGQVSLLKENNDFLWKVNLKNIQMFFSKNKHQFKRLRFDNGISKFSIVAANYLLLDGVHEFPSMFRFSDHVNNTYYNVSVKSLKYKKILDSQRVQKNLTTKMDEPYPFFLK